jgi:hypothetical protein
MRSFLHCYHRDIHGVCPVEREFQNTVVWLNCGFDRPPLRDAVDHFLTDLGHVVDEFFKQLIEQAAQRGLLDLAYCTDSTNVRAMPADPDASKWYDPTDDEYYYGYGCTIVSTGQKVPIATEDLRRLWKRKTTMLFPSTESGLTLDRGGYKHRKTIPSPSGGSTSVVTN